MKKKFSSGAITLTIKSFSTGVVEIKNHNKVLFTSTSPIMLLDVHNVLTQLAVELNADKKPKEDNRKGKRVNK